MVRDLAGAYNDARYPPLVRPPPHGARESRSRRRLEFAVAAGKMPGRSRCASWRAPWQRESPGSRHPLAIRVQNGNGRAQPPAQSRIVAQRDLSIPAFRDLHGVPLFLAGRLNIGESLGKCPRRPPVNLLDSLAQVLVSDALRRSNCFNPLHVIVFLVAEAVFSRTTRKRQLSVFRAAACSVMPFCTQGAEDVDVGSAGFAAAVGSRFRIPFDGWPDIEPKIGSTSAALHD